MIQMLSEASSFTVFIALVLLLIAGAACGFISDVILRDTGFGIAVNGILIVVGSVLGASLRLAF